MIEITVEKRLTASGATEFLATPSVVALGGRGNALVDSLHLTLPPEWDDKMVTVAFLADGDEREVAALLSSDRTLPLLGGMTARGTEGVLTVEAVGEDGYQAYSAPIRYTVYDHPSVGDPSDLPSDRYVALVEETAAAAANAMRAMIDQTYTPDSEDAQSGKAVAEAVALAKAYTDDKVGVGSLTEAQITALDGMFKKCAFTGDVAEEYAAFKEAFGLVGNDETDVYVTSISADYAGGDVYAGTLLIELTGITVTATYSDGSTAIVTDYMLLGGDIAEGKNTITVWHEGETATFTVTGLANDEDAADENDPPFDDLVWQVGTRLTGGGKEYTGHATYSTTEYVGLSGVNSFTISLLDNVGGNVQYICAFYDSEKGYLSDTGAHYMSVNNASYPASVDVTVPEGAAFVRLCGTEWSGNLYGEIIRIRVN